MATEVKAGAKLIALAGVSDYARKLEPKGSGVIAKGDPITVTKDNLETAQRLVDIGVLGPEQAPEPDKAAGQ